MTARLRTPHAQPSGGLRNRHREVITTTPHSGISRNIDDHHTAGVRSVDPDVERSTVSAEANALDHRVRGAGDADDLRVRGVGSGGVHNGHVGTAVTVLTDEDVAAVRTDRDVGHRGRHRIGPCVVAARTRHNVDDIDRVVRGADSTHVGPTCDGMNSERFADPIDGLHNAAGLGVDH